jgi:hypothetical protein
LFRARQRQLVSIAVAAALDPPAHRRLQDQVEHWPHGRMERWPHGRMERWPHGRMERWPHGRMCSRARLALTALRFGALVSPRRVTVLNNGGCIFK